MIHGIMKLNGIGVLFGSVVCGVVVAPPSAPLGLEPSTQVPLGPPSVRHSKEKSGGYKEGSPLYKRQEARVDAGVVGCAGQVRGDVSRCGGNQAQSHEEIPKSAIAVSWMLMGAVVFIMMLFYLVHSHRKGIQGNTWRTLNSTVSIFAAVLVYTHIKSSVAFLLDLHTQDEATEVDFGFAMFMFFFVMSSVDLFFLRRKGREIELLALGTLMSHITAFAAIDAFGELQELTWVKRSGVLVTLVVPLAAVSLLFLEFISYKIRGYVVNRDDRIDEEEAKWLEQTVETENDVHSICIGFLMMQTFRYYITGRMQSVEPGVPPPDTSHTQVTMLFVFSLVTGIAAFFATVYVNRLKREDHNIPTHIRRLMKLGQLFLSMTMAWCLLYWGEWVTYTAFGFNGPRMCGVLLVALLLSAICCVTIIGLDHVGDHMHVGKGRKAMRNFELALGVVVGFSWEKCFDLALENIVESLEWHQAISRVVLLATTLVTVLPAWLWYVLPKTTAN